MDLNQDTRIGKLHSPLPAADLVLMRFNGMDGVNQCFEYQVEALSKETDIDLDAIVGRHMTVELHDRDRNPIYYDGIVVEASWADEGDTGHYYRFTLRPWFWLMSKRRNQKIFQNMSFEEIAQDVCNKFSGDGANVAFQVQGNFPPQEYIVQYRESDMHFLCRLAERYGVNFFFSHDKGVHTLNFVDVVDNFPSIPGGSRDYIASDGDSNDDDEHFWDWSPGRRLTVGKVTTTDYNFTTPSAAMLDDHTGDADYEYGDIESYVYPGISEDKAASKRVAKLRTEQERARDKYHAAVGNVMTLSSGMLMSLNADDHEGDVGGQPYLCVKAIHNYSDGGYRSGGAGGEPLFRGSYEFVPAEVPFAPEMKTDETKMQGPQTALVVGPGGDEIHTDEYGRIKVQFYWDRHGQKDENSSMWVRCAQMWAGSGWGTMFIPRIGMEVVVEFLEGDPNKPLVVGCVYNAENMPPYPLPSDKNWNGMKSNSTIGGGGYNELVFNDTKGEELFRQHAQFDMETRVLNDERRNVDVNRQTSIGNDDTRTVGHDEGHVIENDSTYEIKNDESRTVKNDRTAKVENNETMTVDGDQKETIKKNRTTKVTKADKLSVQSLEVTAKSSIELKVGASSIKMDGQSITIKSPTVTVKGTQEVVTDAGMMATHKAGGIMTVKGSLVKIN